MVELDSGLGRGAVASNILRLIFGHVHDIGAPIPEGTIPLHGIGCLVSRSPETDFQIS